MKKILKMIPLKTINVIEFIIGPVFLLTLFLSLFIQVISRYIFNYPSPMLFEISQYSFIWVVFLGAPLARRYGAHMKFNVLYDKFPKKVQLSMDLIFNLFFTIMLAVTFLPIWDEIIFYHVIKSTVLRIPWTYLLFCYPLFIVLMFIHNLIWIYKNYKELFYGKKTKLEGKPWDY